MTHRFDFLVLGSGVAGLTFALKVADLGSVAIVTKKKSAESNTNWAQGGVAAVVDPNDSTEAHVQDTLVAGAGLCDRSTLLARRSPCPRSTPVPSPPSSRR